MEPNVLSRRIEQLAALAGEEQEAEPTPGGTSVAAVRGEVGALRADLAGLRSELGAIRSELDAMAGRVTGAVSASRSETGALARRVADLVTQVEGVGSRVDDVKTDLPGVVREVRDGLELVPVRTGAKLDELSGKLAESVGTRVEAVAAEVRRTVAAALEREADQAAVTQGLMSEARSSLESRMAVLEDTLDALSERLESVVRDGIKTTRDLLREMATSLAGIDAKVEASAGEQVERIVGRLRDVTEARLDALSLSLVDATRSRNEQLRRELLDVLARASTEQESTRNQVAVLVDAMRHTQTEQTTAMAALEERVGAVLSTTREDITTELDDVAERYLAEAHARREAEDVRASAQDARVDALQASLEAAVEGVRAQTGLALEQVREDLVGEVGALRPRLEEVMAAASAAAAHESAARAELQQALESVRERVAVAVSVSSESVRAALEEALASQTERERTTHEALLDRLEDQHASLTSRLVDLAAGTAGGTAANRDANERIASLTTTLDEVRRAVEALRGEWPARLDQADTTARAAAESVIADVRAEVRAQLDAVLGEMARAAGGIDEARLHLSAAADQVVEQSGLQRADVERTIAFVEKLTGSRTPDSAGTVVPDRTAAVLRIADKLGPAKPAADAGPEKPTAPATTRQPAKKAAVKKAPPPAEVAATRTPSEPAAPRKAKAAAPRKATTATPGKPRVARKSAAPRQAADTDALRKVTAAKSPPVKPPAKRASVTAMPVVPSPASALEAAAPAASRPPVLDADPASAQPTSPAREKPAGEQPAEGDSRRMFRRRRP